MVMQPAARKLLLTWRRPSMQAARPSSGFSLDGPHTCMHAAKLEQEYPGKYWHGTVSGRHAVLVGIGHHL